MSREKCFLDVRNKFKSLSEKELKRIEEDVAAILKKSEGTGKPASEVIEEFSNTYKRKIEMAKHQHLKGIEKYNELRVFINQDSFKAAPKDAVWALFRTDHGKNYKGQASIANKKQNVIETMIKEKN